MQVPPHLVAEILTGKLVTRPRPAPRHTLAGSSLGDELLGPFQKGRGGPGGWWILDEPELHLDDDVLVPDMAGWRRERMPKLPIMSREAETALARERFVNWVEREAVARDHIVALADIVANPWPHRRPPNRSNDPASIRLAQLDERWLKLDV